MAALCSHTLHDAGQCRSGLPLYPDGLLLAEFNEHSACGLGMDEDVGVATGSYSDLVRYEACASGLHVLDYPGQVSYAHRDVCNPSPRFARKRPIGESSEVGSRSSIRVSPTGTMARRPWSTVSSGKMPKSA